MQSCGMELIKYLLFFFNLLFTISGIGLIAAGAKVVADVGGYSNFLEGSVVATPVVLIVIGVIIFLVASLGCCGAIRESAPLLIAYAALLGAVFIAELAAGAAAAASKDRLEDVLKTSMEDSQKHYQNSTIEKTAWDRLQTELTCCGVENSQEWKPLPPKSCCADPDLCLKVYTDGCLEKLKDEVKSSALLLAGVGIGIAFIELAGIVLALFMATSIKKSVDGGGGNSGGGNE
ncbi:CD63 antigen-like [Schistocerca piceifrons]|uniref:CD63 antigen-like n=1 Tax=Schistocerca piceifrons TaxID=274613 RepID=UPI001F5ED09E|nr:CD63 antigen-like [Schistocerca piceifrons]